MLIDCPPNLGLLTVNALSAADEALVPIDMKSVDALARAEELIATVQDWRKTDPKSPRCCPTARRDQHRRRDVYKAIDYELAELALPDRRHTDPRPRRLREVSDPAPAARHLAP